MNYVEKWNEASKHAYVMHVQAGDGHLKNLKHIPLGLVSCLFSALCGWSTA